MLHHVLIVAPFLASTLRRRPTAAELIDQSIRAGDFRTAALLTITGCAEVLHDTRLAEPEADNPDRLLAAAIAQLAPTR